MITIIIIFIYKIITIQLKYNLIENGPKLAWVARSVLLVAPVRVVVMMGAVLGPIAATVTISVRPLLALGIFPALVILE